MPDTNTTETNTNEKMRPETKLRDTASVHITWDGDRPTKEEMAAQLHRFSADLPTSKLARAIVEQYTEATWPHRQHDLQVVSALWPNTLFQMSVNDRQQRQTIWCRDGRSYVNTDPDAPFPPVRLPVDTNNDAAPKLDWQTNHDGTQLTAQVTAGPHTLQATVHPCWRTNQLGWSAVITDGHQNLWTNDWSPSPENAVNLVEVQMSLERSKIADRQETQEQRASTERQALADFLANRQS